MAWNPNIPTVTNRVQDDLNAIRENFQHLDPLAPYVQAIRDSRIVDHNLDVPNPPSGRYIRWANGLQLTMQNVTANVNITDASVYGGYLAIIGQALAYPAAFSEVYARQVSLTSEHAVSIQFHSAGTGLIGFSLQVRAIAQQANVTINANVITIGRWK